MKKLKGLRVAVLAADGFEQVELTAPVKKLERQGADVTIVSPPQGPHPRDEPSHSREKGERGRVPA